jgi:ATP-dependent Lon protease
MAETATVGPVTPVWSLPVLPLKNTVLFPHLFLPLSVGRAGSVAAVQAVLATEEKALVLFAQRDPAADQPPPEGLYAVGTRAVVKKVARTQETVEMLVQGLERVRLVRVEQTEPFLKAQVEPAPVPEDNSTEVEALYRALLDLARRAVELSQVETPVNIDQLVAQAGDPLHVAYLLGSMLPMDVPREQALLEAPTRGEALRIVHEYLAHEVQVLELRQKIASKAETELNREQREYVLRQQLRAITEELGESTPEKAEVETLRQRLQETDLPDEVRKEAERELHRLERMPAAAPDFQVTRAYLDFILELPWRKSTTDNLDLAHARTVLDEDHYDLEDIKERILEHLAVLKLNPGAKAPICA